MMDTNHSDRWALPYPALNNYILDCDACPTPRFVYWLRNEIPGYDTSEGMSCPQCGSHGVVLRDCDEANAHHRAAKARYRLAHPELFPPAVVTEREEGDDALNDRLADVHVYSYFGHRVVRR